MFIGGLRLAALPAWKPRRAQRSDNVWGNYASGVTARRVEVTTMPPRGVIAVAPETRHVLDVANEFARNRCVELQVALEHGLVAQVDALAYRTCLRRLLMEAIDRASGGVLVTGTRQADGVEIAVLDDCPTPVGVSASPGGDRSVPPGATLKAEYQPHCGTTIRLRLPQPDRSAWQPRAAEEFAVFADHQLAQR